MMGVHFGLREIVNTSEENIKKSLLEVITEWLPYNFP